ncbi:MAG: hypothetical protein R3E08_11560 [Thiotrichaceae bacterium]
MTKFEIEFEKLNFEESRLKFNFADTWQIFQLDSSNFYRKRLSAQVEETKAVDFVGIHQQVLYFVEVKNFKGHRIENKGRLEKSELSTESAQKVRDSIACIIAANRSSETEKWQDYKKLLCNPETMLKVIIWLEQDLPKYRRQKARNSTEIKRFKEKLSWLTSQVFVVNQENHRLPDVTVENSSHAQ